MSGNISPKTPTRSFWSQLAYVSSLLPARHRSRGIVVGILAILAGALELITVIILVPVLAIIVGKDQSGEVTQVEAAAGALGIAIGDDVAILLALFCLTILAAAIARIIIVWFSQIYTGLLGHEIAETLFSRALYQPYIQHLRQNSSDSLAGVTKAQQLVSMVIRPLLEVLTSIIIVLGIVIALSIVAFKAVLALAVLLGLPYVIVSLIARKHLRRNGRIIAGMITARLSIVQEGLGGIRDVKIDQVQPAYLREFRKVGLRLWNAMVRNSVIAIVPRYVMEAGGLIVFAILAVFASSGESGFGTVLPALGALALGAQRLLPLLQAIHRGTTQIIGNRALLSDVIDLLEDTRPADGQLANSDRSRGQPMPFNLAISIENMHFSFAQEGPALFSDVNFAIAKGSTTGFVGQSGSGKSTVIDLLAGLLHPDKGAILIDGMELDQSNVAGWQENIAYVSQHIFLTDSSIARNIAFGIARGDVDMKRVREAARNADLGQFISEQPEGFDTIVGERGIRLSGGQRQRIGIARALYKAAPVLILDEATSALDNATEARVLANINKLGANLTVIVAAHRSAALTSCDDIYRVENSKIAKIANNTI